MRVLAALVVALPIGLLSACSAAKSTEPAVEVGVLDKAALDGDNGVKKILTEGYGFKATDIKSVNCPADQEARKGTKFTCTATIGGKDQVIDIEVLDDNGQYQVGQPHDK